MKRTSRRKNDFYSYRAVAVGDETIIVTPKGLQPGGRISCSDSGALRDSRQQFSTTCRALLACVRDMDRDVVLTEHLERISSDQADVATVCEQTRVSRNPLVTISDNGPVNELHVGVSGMVSAMFVRNVADKTRRGQPGKVAIRSESFESHLKKATATPEKQSED